MRMQREGKHSILRTKGLEEIVSPLVAIKLRVSPTAVCYDALYISCTDRSISSFKFQGPRYVLARGFK